MDNLKFQERCERHLDEKIKYLRINSSIESQQKPFFYCEQCMNQDRSFNINDYLWIKELIQKGDNSILHKWPPINKPEIIDKLIEFSSGNGYKNDVIQKIICFFENLKRSINEEIDICQKNMVLIAETQIQNTNHDQIIKQYQQISKITELRNNLLNNNINVKEKERICKDIIKSQQNQSQSNNNSSSQLEKLLMSNTQQITFNPSSAEAIQQSILNNIQSIQLLQQKNPSEQILNNYFIPQQNNESYQISFNNKNQSQAKIISYNSIGYAVSNVVINSNDKYIFRIKIDDLQINHLFTFGLLIGEDINNKEGYYSLYCYLKNINGIILNPTGSADSISKQIKGGEFKLLDEREIEFRICIKEKIVHILDYPKYQHILGLKDEYLSYLNEAKNFRLSIKLNNFDNQVTLTESKIVQSFDY